MKRDIKGDTMTKIEVQAQHDQEVKAAIAEVLSSYMTDETIDADDCYEHWLAALLSAAARAQVVHDKWSGYRPVDASIDPTAADWWRLEFNLGSTMASVLWWFMHSPDTAGLDALPVRSVGGAPFDAFGAFTFIRKLRTACDGEVQTCLEMNISDRRIVDIAALVRQLPPENDL